MDALVTAVETLRAALRTVDGLRVAGGLGQTLDAPLAVVPPPRLIWSLPGPVPAEATFTVPIIVALNDKTVDELLKWGPLAAAAVDGQVPAAVMRTADLGSWRLGSTDMPAYLLEIDYAL